ncbi:hypothetical protein ON010_g5102 [Phytophthora cinnamomi]|nr:hypothetical protein ON010_g5102 [Phytophthora cinnamomi]
MKASLSTQQNLVYDIILESNDEQFKVTMFQKLDQAFGIKDQGISHDFLGVQVEIREEGIKLHQTKYAQQILDRFGFSEDQGSRSPMETSMKLQAARPHDKADVSFCLSCCHHGIFFDHKKAESMADAITIDGFCDADWANCPDTRKSISGFVLKVAGGTVPWSARRQPVVAQSTAKIKYVAACEACMEGRELANVLMEVLPETIPVHFKHGIDSQSAVALATNPTYSRRTRHIELRYHFARDQVTQGQVLLCKVSGLGNPADVLMKTVALPKFVKTKTLIGMVPATVPTPGEVKRKQCFAGRHPTAEHMGLLKGQEVGRKAAVMVPWFRSDLWRTACWKAVCDEEQNAVGLRELSSKVSKKYRGNSTEARGVSSFTEASPTYCNKVQKRTSCTGGPCYLRRPAKYCWRFTSPGVGTVAGTIPMRVLVLANFGRATVFVRASAGISNPDTLHNMGVLLSSLRVLFGALPMSPQLGEGFVWPTWQEIWPKQSDAAPPTGITQQTDNELW